MQNDNVGSCQTCGITLARRYIARRSTWTGRGGARDPRCPRRMSFTESGDLRCCMPGQWLVRMASCSSPDSVPSLPTQLNARKNCAVHNVAAQIIDPHPIVPFSFEGLDETEDFKQVGLLLEGLGPDSQCASRGVLLRAVAESAPTAVSSAPLAGPQDVQSGVAAGRIRRRSRASPGRSRGRGLRW